LLLVFFPLTLHAQTTDFERGLYDRIMKPDKSKTFDPRAAASIGSRAFGARGAATQDFHFQQRFTPREFRSKEFAGTKSSWLSRFKFSTKDARTQTYAGPNAAKAAEPKTAPTKEAPDADKAAAVRALPGGDRPYLGPEAARMKTPLDPMNLPRTTSDLRELKTIEDIRELLNKNK
jgi:hypothetical protein